MASCKCALCMVYHFFQWLVFNASINAFLKSIFFHLNYVIFSSITSISRKFLQSFEHSLSSPFFPHRYVISDDRVLFQLTDGSLAFEIRDFLVTQDTCKTVSFEQMEFPCKPKKSEL